MDVKKFQFWPPSHSLCSEGTQLVTWESRGEERPTVSVATPAHLIENGGRNFDHVERGGVWGRCSNITQFLYLILWDFSVWGEFSGSSEDSLYDLEQLQHRNLADSDIEFFTCIIAPATTGDIPLMNIYFAVYN